MRREFETNFGDDAGGGKKNSTTQKKRKIFSENRTSNQSFLISLLYKNNWNGCHTFLSLCC